MFNYALAALLQLSMFLLVEAAPVTVQSAKPWQAGTGTWRLIELRRLSANSHRWRYHWFHRSCPRHYRLE